MDCQKLTDIYSKTCVDLVENSTKYNKIILETTDLKILNCYSIMFKINSFCTEKNNFNDQKKININLR